MGIRAVGFKITNACARIITPGLQYSQNSYRDTLLPLLKGKKRWLDIGCGHQLFAQWMRKDQQEAIASCGQAFGCDLDFEGMRNHPDLNNKCMASGYALPFESNTMDVISANMVMEHVDQPEAFFSEVARVLVPGGLFVFHTPNRNGINTKISHMLKNETVKHALIKILENREEEDVFPAFYRVNDLEAIHGLARNQGLGVKSLRTVETSPILSSFGPLSIPELLFIRALRAPWGERYRATIISILAKPMAASG